MTDSYTEANKKAIAFLKEEDVLGGFLFSMGKCPLCESVQTRTSKALALGVASHRPRG